MTRGRKRSASTVRDKVERILGIDDNPYGLPPVAKDPDADKKLCYLHDPSRIPFLGKLWPKPKPKAAVSRRRRSSSLPARYQAIYAETAPGIEITPEHFVDFDRREKAYYDFFPHLRPCMTVEEYDKEYAKWEANCNIRFFEKNPLNYYHWERMFGSCELLNPREVPRPPGWVERPKSKALPPLPSPSDIRSTCDTDYLISQFPPAPETIPSPLPVVVKTKTAQSPPQRPRSSSEGTIIPPRTEEAIRWVLGLNFAPDIRSAQCHCEDDSYAGTLSRPTVVQHLDEDRAPSRPPTHIVNMFRAQEAKSNHITPPPTAVTLALEAQLTEWAEETNTKHTRAGSRAEALMKLEKNQIQGHFTVLEPQNAVFERDFHGDYRANVEETTYKDELERKSGDEHKHHVEKDHQRQRLKSEPRLSSHHGPSSSAASGAQENWQPHDGNRRRKDLRPQLEEAARVVQDERDRRERKTEWNRQRERNKSEPKRQAPAPSISSTMAQDSSRERQPDSNTRAGMKSRAQDDTRRRNVRKSISTSTLYDMVESKSHVPPHGLRRQANADAPVRVPPPSVSITPITSSNRGMRITASNSTATPAPAQGQGPKAIRPRPSRPNLGPPPSLSSGASGHRTRAPSITQRTEESAHPKEPMTGVVLNRKTSNSNLVNKGTVSVPVRNIKDGETGMNRLHHARLHVQDIQVTMIPLSYYVNHPDSESAGLKATAQEQSAEAPGNGAFSQATTSATQFVPTTPPATQTLHIFNNTAEGCPSSASSCGSSPGYTTSSYYGGYAASSTTTLATHYGYVQRSYEDNIYPAQAKIIAPGTLDTSDPTPTEPRTKKTSLTPMHVPLPKTGLRTGGATRSTPQVNALASSSRDVIDNISKGKHLPTDVDPDFDDEELIKGYKPRKFVDVKKLIQDERDRIHRERKELPAIPFPTGTGNTAPLRIRKKTSQLQA